jgi:hypothetical protein
MAKDAVVVATGVFVLMISTPSEGAFGATPQSIDVVEHAGFREMFSGQPNDLEFAFCGLIPKFFDLSFSCFYLFCHLIFMSFF